MSLIPPSVQENYADHADTLQHFTNALQKGMDYTATHSAQEIASIIQPQFKETDLDTITTIVTRYQCQDTWKTDLIFEQSSFELLENILMEAGELDSFVPYNELVDTSYAQKAIADK